MSKLFAVHLGIFYQLPVQINPLESQIIQELISDLCSNHLSNDLQRKYVRESLHAYKNPYEYIQENEENLGWITVSLETASQFISSSVPAIVLSHSIVDHLSEYFISGIELENIHLKIKQKLQHKKFPEIDKYYKSITISNSQNETILSFGKYKNWLKKQIIKVNPDLTAVYFDDHFNDNLYLCLIKTENKQRILANCQLLGIHIKEI